MTQNMGPIHHCNSWKIYLVATNGGTCSGTVSDGYKYFNCDKVSYHLIKDCEKSINKERIVLKQEEFNAAQ